MIDDRALLEERARRLAQPLAAPAPADTLELVTFTLANETYAVESRYVVQVFKLADLSVFPGAVAPLFGVTAWRGDLLTILDLRPVLGLSVGALNDLSTVIVLARVGERGLFGILADTVRGVVTLPAAAVRDPAQVADRTYIRGITGDAVLVLEARALLDLGGTQPE